MALHIPLGAMFFPLTLLPLSAMSTLFHPGGMDFYALVVVGFLLAVRFLPDRRISTSQRKAIAVSGSVSSIVLHFLLLFIF